MTGVAGPWKENDSKRLSWEKMGQNYRVSKSVEKRGEIQRIMFVR